VNSSHVTQYFSIDGTKRDDNEEQGDKVVAIQIDGPLAEQQPPAVVVVPPVYHYRAPNRMRNNWIVWDHRISFINTSFLWCFLPAAVLSWCCQSVIFSRVNPSNCNLQLYKQSPTLNVQSHNVSSWYFQDWGLISNQGFCPLESYKYEEYIDNDGNRHTNKTKVYQNCYSWTNSVWKDWDSENEYNGNGKTNFQQGASVWSSSVTIEMVFAIVPLSLGVLLSSFLYFYRFSVVVSCRFWVLVFYSLLAVTFFVWVFLLGFMMETDQLDPAALQKNLFPSCDVSINKLYEGSILAICIIILGGLNLLIFILLIKAMLKNFLYI